MAGEVWGRAAGLACGVLLVLAGGVRAEPGLRRFTLDCVSRKSPPPPVPRYQIDINLDVGSYYTDSPYNGGLDQIESDDGDRIMLRRHGGDVHGVPMFSLQAYFRSNGHFYYSSGTGQTKDAPPDIVCTMGPPREGFMADKLYDGPLAGRISPPGAP